jgi:hypothetical protein
MLRTAHDESVRRRRLCCRPAFSILFKRRSRLAPDGNAFIPFSTGASPAREGADAAPRRLHGLERRQRRRLDIEVRARVLVEVLQGVFGLRIPRRGIPRIASDLTQMEAQELRNI